MQNLHGAQLSKWEIKQRLVQMNIPFDGSILSKEYYIKLYDNAILKLSSEDIKRNTEEDKDNIYNEAERRRKIREIEMEKMRRKHIQPMIDHDCQIEDDLKQKDFANYQCFTKPPMISDLNKDKEHKEKKSYKNDNSYSRENSYLEYGAIGFGISIIAYLLIQSYFPHYNYRLYITESMTSIRDIILRSDIMNAMDYLSRLNTFDFGVLIIVFFIVILLFALLNKYKRHKIKNELI